MSLTRIEIKTTGQLIDESQIVWLKMQHGLTDLIPVYRQYEEAMARRVAVMPDHKVSTEPGLKLMEINQAIWNLINVVVNWRGSHVDAIRIAQAAAQIQQMNQERVKLIKRINDIFGDSYDNGQGIKVYK